MADLRTTLTAALVALATTGGSLLFESGSCWAGAPTNAMPPLITRAGTSTNVIGKMAMITTRHALFAWHSRYALNLMAYNPATENDTTVNNPGSVATVDGGEYGVLYLRKLGSTDIGIATLDSETSADPMPSMPANVTTYINAMASGIPVVLAENRNKYAVACELTGLANVKQATDPAFAPYVEQFNQGDSSGLVMSVLDGGFILWGTIGFKPTPIGVPADSSGFPSISENIDAINAVLNLDHELGDYAIEVAALDGYDTVAPTIAYATATQANRTFTLQCGVNSGTTPRTIQWYRSTSDDMTDQVAIDGADSTYATATISESGNYYFRLTVTSEDAKTTNSQILGPYAVIGGNMAGTWSIVRQGAALSFSLGALYSYGGNAYVWNLDDGVEYTINLTDLSAAPTSPEKTLPSITLPTAAIEADATYLLVASSIPTRRVHKVNKSDLTVASYGLLPTANNGLGLVMLSATTFAAISTNSGNTITRVYNLSAVTGSALMTANSTTTLATGETIAGNFGGALPDGTLPMFVLDGTDVKVLADDAASVVATADLLALIPDGFQCAASIGNNEQIVIDNTGIPYIVRYTPASTAEPIKGFPPFAASSDPASDVDSEVASDV